MNQPIGWRYCACAGPSPQAGALLFLAAHLLLDPLEAELLLDQYDMPGLIAMETSLHALAQATRAHLTTEHPGFDQLHDPDDLWWTFDAMTDPRLLHGPAAEQLLADRDHDRLPPPGDTGAWITLLHAQASLISSLYSPVALDLDTVEHQLRRDALRLIQADAR